MEAEDQKKIKPEQQQEKNLDPSPAEDQPTNNNQLLDTDFFFLIIILLIFFQRPDMFSEKLQLVDEQVQEVKKYLDTADATLQALNQASQIPHQELN